MNKVIKQFCKVCVGFKDCKLRTSDIVPRCVTLNTFLNGYEEGRQEAAEDAQEWLVKHSNLSDWQLKGLRKAIERASLTDSVPEESEYNPFDDFRKSDSEKQFVGQNEKYIADIFEKVGLAKIVRNLANDEFTNALQSAMIELAKGNRRIEEPVSEVLDEAAEDFAYREWDGLHDEDGGPLFIGDYIQYSFREGAQWQKQQTISKAVEWLQRNIDSRDWLMEFRMYLEE